MGEQHGVGENHRGHGKVRTRGEEANVKGKRVVVAVDAEDEEVEDGEGDEGGVVVAAACGDGKGIEKDVGVEKEDHALLQGTVDVGDEIQTAVAVEYWVLVAAVGHRPWQKQLHNCEVVDP